MPLVLFCFSLTDCTGDAFRGATSVSLHNGGGTGWGEAINGGFLLLLDGTDAASKRAQKMLFWDVNNGVSRRSWSGNACAEFQIKQAMLKEPRLDVILPQHAKLDLIDDLFTSAKNKSKEDDNKISKKQKH